ncbi:MAG TPA: metal-dependent hydrolase [Ktedonobacterales bacterium]|nr:metal-dependent hydrolase [Ktedonobacterales bacterium]
MRGPSHVVFGLAGAVVVSSVTPVHLAGPPLTLAGPFSPDLLAEKIIYYGFAALGALTPDIDNARSTLGERLGSVSKEIQHLAGHRTFFHSLVGLVSVGAVVWAAQYALGLALYYLGLHRTGAALGSGIAPGGFLAPGVGIAFGGLMIGYFLHLVADSLTEGGVPWLWPSKARYGFPPDRHWRFRTGSVWEPIIVVAVAVLVIVGVVFGKLTM